MISEPVFEKRDAQPYVAIRADVDMKEIGTTAPPLIQRVYEWLNKQGHTPDGPLFFRYIRMYEGRRLDLEVGVPVMEALDGDDEVKPGTFPAGRYAVARYQGAYEGLPKAWNAFEEWREESGTAEKVQVAEDGTRRGARAERYIVGPNDNPDPEKWETELVLYIDETT